VAEVLGVDTTSISNWEKNRCQPKLYLIPRIVRFLDYNPFPSPKGTTTGERIKAHRRMLGISQKRLAEILDVDPSILASWEKGTTQPSGRLKERVDDMLNSPAPNQNQICDDEGLAPGNGDI
jgi:DNA-binding transcriptional regulator YiaG